MVSAVSFAGFISVKLYGEKKGIKLTSFFGGLVNSDATVASISQKIKSAGSRAKKLVPSYVSSAILSNTSMLIRNLIIVFIAGGYLLLPKLTVYVSIMIFVSLLTIFAETFRKDKSKTHKTKLTTPFAIKPAIKFGVLFFVLYVIVNLANSYFGDTGLVFVTILGSLINSSAIVASIASSTASESITLSTGITMILVTCTISVAKKLFIAKVMGNKLFYKKMILPTAVTTVVGLILIAVSFLFF